MAGKTTKSAKPADSPDEKKPYTIIDINHPGKSAANASGVPVIVSNRPVLKDPMVVDNSDEEPATGETVLKRTKKINVKPLGDEDDEVATKPEEHDSTKTIAEIAVEADAKAVDKKSKSQPDETSKDKPGKSESAKEDEVPVDDVNEPADSKPEAEPEEPEPEADESTENDDVLTGELDEGDKKLGDADPKAAEAARKAAEKQLALDKLAAAGTYELPINAVEKRRVKRFAIIIVAVLILLCAAWVDLALDAQLIQINGVNAPTDFFPDR